jgi:predicted kinase
VQPSQPFVILAGLPGSGKSTLAARLQREHGFLIVSTDALRQAINAGVYPRPEPAGNYDLLDPIVMRLARQAVEELLRTGCPAGIDATNLSRRRRRFWLDVARAVVPDVAVTLWWCTGDWDSPQRWQRERGYTAAEYQELRARLLAWREWPTADEGFTLRIYDGEERPGEASDAGQT